MNRSRGVSLVEALVALAVMAFGLLGVVGLQATMRTNADIAKQRSEAVRLTQETLEQRRSFTTLSATVGQRAYADVITRAPVEIAGTNATYVLTETVANAANGRMKTLTVDVTWLDRTQQQQRVRLTSTMAGTLPELAGAVGVPPYGSPTRTPRGRHSAIPQQAVDQGDGTSRFAPPGGDSLRWVFDNTTGFITRTCNGTDCVAANARLLAGFIGFAMSSTQPTPAMAEMPPSTSFDVGVSVQTTFPTSGTVQCFEEAHPLYVAYFCAVPVSALSGNVWSGRSLLQLSSLAGDLNDDNPGHRKVCRYTPVRNAHPVVPDISNEAHPLDYAQVSTSLTNQNFLVIRAGDDEDPFVCPADNSSTPLVNGNTWHHQPIS